MKTCSNCVYARQRCKMDDQDIVGCTIVEVHEAKTGSAKFHGKGNIYTGWFYNNRRVGDISERSDIGSGAMVNGVLVDYTQGCSKWYPIGE